MISLLIALSLSYGPKDNGFDSSFDNRAFGVAATSTSPLPDSSRRANTPRTSLPETRTITEPVCSNLVPESPSCFGPNRGYIQSCEDGATSVPNIVTTYDSATNEVLSSVIRYISCDASEPTPQAAPIVVTARDFQQLDLKNSPLTILPDDGDLYVNLPIYLNTNAEPQTLDTDLLGSPVSIKATPTKFSWDYGDGTTRTGTTPGATYPDETYAHTYKTPGTYTITLTTSWSGEYSTDGGATWTPIDGTAATTSTSNPLHVNESIPLLTK